MEYEWDAEKAAQNLAKHNVDFSGARSVFKDIDALVAPDNRRDYREPRFNIIAKDIAGDVLTVTFTIRGDVVRLISARKASRDERKRYHGQS